MMKKRPNIILFITHDQGQFASCYQSSQVPITVDTPHIDSIAKDGVQFMNHFCAAPQCSPSRGAMQTSKYPHQNGLMGLVNRGWTLPESNKTLPMFLKEQGYTTHLIGFQHEAKDPKTLGYDSISKRQFEFKYSCKIQQSNYFRFLMDHRNDEEPFFLCIGTPETHRPFIMFGKPVPYHGVKVPPYLPDHDDIKKDYAEFYGSILQTDEVIGNLLKALEITGLKEDTLFIYTTDHGEAFPRAKCTLYDPGTKIVLMMSHPNSDTIKGGKQINGLTSNIDIIPTLLDIIGAEIPQEIEGKSIFPLISGEKDQIHEEIHTEITYHEAYNPIRAVRTKDYKYIRNFVPMSQEYYMPKDIAGDYAGKVMKSRIQHSRPMEEFYDLKKDPLEKTNLIGDPVYAEKVSHYRERLEKWMEETSDPLLEGRILPQKRVANNFLKIELFEHIFLPLEGLFQRLMRIKGFHKYIEKFLRYLF